MTDEFMPEELIEVQNLDGGDEIRIDGRWREILYTKRQGPCIFMTVYDEEADANRSAERTYLTFITVKRRARKLKPRKPNFALEA